MPQQNKEWVIEAGNVEQRYWQDLWYYRELFYFLAWRDILVRYKQTAIGVTWALLQPFLIMVVFSIVFGEMANFSDEFPELPYPIVVYAALLPWQFFATALGNASASLVNSAHVISKIYFPRLIIPVSAIVVSVVDFLLSGFILLGLMVWYNFVPSWRIIFLPGFLAIAALASLGVGLWMATLNVRYRDFRFVIPFVIQFGLYISPVGYVSTKVPPQWQLLYHLNPMVSVIDGFRWAIIGASSPVYVPGFILSLVLLAAILVSSIWYFRHTERTFADII